MLKGGETGPAVVPGKPEDSVLLEMISGGKPEMPRKEKPLSTQEVASIRTWIAEGAHWPNTLVLKDRHLEGRTWWAFELLRRPAVPDCAAPTGFVRRSMRSY